MMQKCSFCVPTVFGSSFAIDAQICRVFSRTYNGEEYETKHYCQYIVWRNTVRMPDRRFIAEWAVQLMYMLYV